MLIRIWVQWIQIQTAPQRDFSPLIVEIFVLSSWFCIYNMVAFTFTWFTFVPNSCKRCGSFSTRDGSVEGVGPHICGTGLLGTCPFLECQILKRVEVLLWNRPNWPFVDQWRDHQTVSMWRLGPTAARWNPRRRRKNQWFASWSLSKWCLSIASVPRIDF